MTIDGEFTDLAKTKENHIIMEEDLESKKVKLKIFFSQNFEL